ncbi:NADH-ubiquinone/plastoquinone oxidoreductase chain 6 [Kribbella flavida DSM 17836]|uniref:NADH-quinone oxidoreductase subunit J n=1 Tax=Kribbella flavida (strain DSM 17836 / JCM 10339 / NBRC 14399) TaxID=479435 RepID=D2PVJ4_KRIFD|nr:NADH-quinone oxidoreductase subunit J [Kribbella flavida]ADB35234.1 NADH-ubiquinone/plastoquinone oxidoreductase chain 6 [Kribbella flavida DSM 17836]
MTTALFSVAGAVALVAAVLVVTSRRIVHAALWLVVALGAVAGCFGALHAEFVALVQILVYVGAIVVLVLFALMLTKAPTNPLPALTTRRSPFAAVVAGALAVLLGAGVVIAFGNEKIGPVPAGSAEAVGTSVFRIWVLPFEVLSVLLLAALIGAIVLSHRKVSEPAEKVSSPGKED